MSEPTSRTGQDNWGRWGPDDERGALNLLTPEVVLAATKACRTGKVYRLALPLQRNGVPIVAYRGAPQRLSLLASDDTLLRGVGVPEGTGACEDVLILPSHSVTHMDALSHVYSDGSFYNGFAATDFHTHGGASRCGVEKVGGVVTRSIMLDIAGLYGRAWLEPDHLVHADEIRACAAAQDVEIREGDAVLVRTGWVERFVEAAGRREDPGHAQPGLALDAAQLLAALDVALVGADNSGIEPLPFPEGKPLAVHTELLVRRGIHLIENLWLADLAADRCHVGMFMVAPLPVTGASGSPVAPVVVG